MLERNDAKFKELVEKGIPIERLERRLRPNNYSDVGFLGVNESLLDVVHGDWEVVERYGTTHEEIAEALAKALAKVLAIPIGSQKMPNPEYKIHHLCKFMGLQDCPWECGERLRLEAESRSPGFREMSRRWECGERLEVESKQTGFGDASLRWERIERYEGGSSQIVIYNVQKVSQQGLMENRKAKENEQALNQYDFWVSFLRSDPKDRGNLADSVGFVTELHPHLIGEHYFFEGKQSPYRVDPILLVPALNLARHPE